MKKITRLFAAVCVFAAAASCADRLSVVDEIQGETKLVPCTFEASMPDTKATLNGLEVLWQEGDKIAVYDNKHAKTEFTLKSGAGTKTAVFEGTIAAGYTGFYVVYPASAAGTKGEITVPAKQSIAAGATVDPAALIMKYGDKGTMKSPKVRSFSMENVCGVARMTVPAGTTSATFSGNYSFYTVVFAAAPSAASSVDVVLPVAKYEDILVAVTTGAESFVKASANPLNIHKGEVVKLGDVKGDPAVLIKNAAEFKSFLEGWPKLNAYVLSDLDLTGVEIPDTATVTGVFDGRGCAIKNATLKAPVFNVNNGTVKNVVIDKSCAVTPTKAENGALQVANVAATNNGSINKCVNNAAIKFESKESVNTGESGKVVAFAGITVLNYGTIEGCVNNADITYSVEGVSNAWGIAGIAAYSEGGITACQNNGKLSCSAERCDAKKAIGVQTAATGCLGGIVCYAGVGMSVADCINNGALSYKVSKIEDATANMNRNQIGGIAAAPSGNITNCQNLGDITVSDVTSTRTGYSSFEYIVGVGGISGGDYFAKGEVSSNATNISKCVNSGNIVVEIDAFKANSTVGGVVAWPGVESAAQTVVTSNCINRGDITISGAGKGRFGGVQGGSGNVEYCVNFGTITNNISVSGSCVGGISGYRSNNLFIRNCENYGKIVNTHAELVYTGGLIGAWGNADFSSGEGCSVNCEMECTGADDTDLHKFSGMVIGRFNGDKTDVLGSDANPINVRGSVSLAGEKTVLDATNYKQWCHGTERTSNLTTDGASKRTLYVKFEEPLLEYKGETYKIVKLKDNRWWMAENLRYVPDGKAVSKADFSTNTGIWYPCVTSGDKSVAASTDAATIKSQGYFYSPAVAFANDKLVWQLDVDQENNQGICPDGWHIPTLNEVIALVGKCNDGTKTDKKAPYYNKTDDRCNLKELNADGFNILPLSYVNNGSSYGNRVLNTAGVEDYRGMNSMGYFYTSTGRSATQCYSIMISNVAASTTAVAGYQNLTYGASVRCVKNK